MSARSSTSNFEPIRPTYLWLLLAGVAGWALAYLAFTWVINPYGVSPVNVTIPGVNEYKPKRRDIDRHIKPVEVWLKQPKTVFLGTSRIHQSIDPSAMEGTGYWPAYNASVPAVTLTMNTSYIELYAELDPKLEQAFVELFLFNFFRKIQDRTPMTRKAMIESALTLNFSLDALRDTFATLGYNFLVHKPIYEIKPGGYFYYPPGHPASAVFNGFPKAMWGLYVSDNCSYRLHEPALDAIHEMIEVAAARRVHLHFFATPNHAYSDYFVERAGLWDVVEQWLLRVTQMTPVCSFAQPNGWTYEAVEPGMRYWNDPFHFSLEMGRGMQTAFLGKPLDGRPENFMVVLRPQDVPAHIAERRRAITAWAAQHPDFVKEFDAAILADKCP